jgi:excisionase family DNA binding protein
MRTKRGDNALLTYEQAASYLGRSRAHVSLLVRDRHLTPVRQRRELLIPQSDLDSYIRSNFVGGVDGYRAAVEADSQARLRELKRDSAAAVRQHKVDLAQLNASALGVAAAPSCAVATPRHVETTASKGRVVRGSRWVVKKGRLLSRSEMRQVAAMLQDRHIVATAGAEIGDPKRAREELAKADAILAKHGIVPAER